MQERIRKYESNKCRIRNRVVSINMTKPEAQTRSELIDKRLAEAGWNVQDPTQVAEEFVIAKTAI